MDRLSLRKKRVINEVLKTEQTVENSLYETIVISDDDDVASVASATSENDRATKVLVVTQDNGNNDIFDKSTDSVNSDEGEHTFIASLSGVRQKTTLFNWPKEERLEKIEPKEETLEKMELKEETEKIEPEEEIPQVALQKQYMIGGIMVKFPEKPYSSQLAVMNKVVQGCGKKEHCLLESPTGCGKTLALLCSVLAWHDHHIATVNKEKWASVKPGGAVSIGNPNNDVPSCSHNISECEMEQDEQDFEEGWDCEKQKAPKIPKIYYGTRTHKQIEQVIRELRKTAYTHKRMTILSSREHTCIQNTNKSKTELCNELLDPTQLKGCPFYNDHNKKVISTFHGLANRGLGSVWDIEELVSLGRKENACPYFAARNLMEHADIIFCPYNYIIDPYIRESMQLDLRDQIIILDEAHNVEDISREVASVMFRDDQLATVEAECNALAIQRNLDFKTYNTLKTYIHKLMTFIKEYCLDSVEKSDDLQSPYWSGAELLELFNMNHIGETEFEAFTIACTAALNDANKTREESRASQKDVKPIVSPATKMILEQLVFSMKMITSPEYVNDYRACLVETTVKDYRSVTEDTWHSFKKRANRARILKLICMNPGVTFSPLSKTARCVILASGTLTPTDSFQSELNTKFVHILNTGHVIPKKQVFTTCVPMGPNRFFLKANYQNVNSFRFQDELGSVLLDICESIPHGILCFLSSYNVMYKITERWRRTSTWSNISRTKKIFLEPRYGGELTEIMKDYRQVIEDTSLRSSGTINGALFLAVFRGKVAEGIDFKDNEARCVVSVGIPYPVRLDPEVDMKYKYNDDNVSKGLLKGTEWYSIQAFRALNQALGRCLRHINDWGAVLLVDERFQYPAFKANLPKWVKMMWTEQKGYNLKEELCNFVARQKANETKDA